jgi:hypothetical protein
MDWLLLAGVTEAVFDHYASSHFSPRPGSLRHHFVRIQHVFLRCALIEVLVALRGIVE